MSTARMVQTFLCALFAGLALGLTAPAETQAIEWHFLRGISVTAYRQ